MTLKSSSLLGMALAVQAMRSMGAHPPVRYSRDVPASKPSGKDRSKVKAARKQNRDRRRKK